MNKNKQQLQEQPLAEHIGKIMEGVQGVLAHLTRKSAKKPLVMEVMVPMPDAALNPQQAVAKHIATWFGAGLARKAPGTVGTLAAMPFIYLIHVLFGAPGVFAFWLVASAAGYWATKVYLPFSASEDPKEVVIDEVAGIAMLLAVLPPTWQGYGLGFVLFRFFDIVKPWPVSWADRNVKGALGVMLDDTVAAFYPVFFMLAAMLLFPHTFTPIMAWLER